MIFSSRLSLSLTLPFQVDIEKGGRHDRSLDSNAKINLLLQKIDWLIKHLSIYDRLIVEKLKKYGESVNQYWGFLSRSGFGDKTHLIHQMEKNADVYTSRVSNLLPYTPYACFRADPQSLAHEVAVV